MRPHEYYELAKDAKRARVNVGGKHLRAILVYTRSRRAPYSPEYVTTYAWFNSTPVLFAYWDALRTLYNDIVRNDSNMITKKLGITDAEDILFFGYVVPAKLCISDERRGWLLRKMHTHPLLMETWLYACSACLYTDSTIGEHMLDETHSNVETHEKNRQECKVDNNHMR